MDGPESEKWPLPSASNPVARSLVDSREEQQQLTFTALKGPENGRRAYATFNRDDVEQQELLPIPVRSGEGWCTMTDREILQLWAKLNRLNMLTQILGSMHAGFVLWYDVAVMEGLWSPWSFVWFNFALFMHITGLALAIWALKRLESLEANDAADGC
ncbi:hypothetical protein LTS10_002470 [Elasticomyces elasticus]|nr:hypothetical protein LTS10_002470 [Elasticomyces elasticus]